MQWFYFFGTNVNVHYETRRTPLSTWFGILSRITIERFSRTIRLWIDNNHALSQRIDPFDFLSLSMFKKNFQLSPRSLWPTHSQTQCRYDHVASNFDFFKQERNLFLSAAILQLKTDKVQICFFNRIYTVSYKYNHLHVKVNFINILDFDLRRWNG